MEISFCPIVFQWIMIYSSGINTDLGIDPKSIPYTGISGGQIEGQDLL